MWDCRWDCRGAKWCQMVPNTRISWISWSKPFFCLIKNYNPSLRTWGRFWAKFAKIVWQQGEMKVRLSHFWCQVHECLLRFHLRSCLTTNESIALVWVEGLDFTWAKDDLKLLKLRVLDGSSWQKACNPTLFHRLVRQKLGNKPGIKTLGVFQILTIVFPKPYHSFWVSCVFLLRSPFPATTNIKHQDAEVCLL